MAIVDFDPALMWPAPNFDGAAYTPAPAIKRRVATRLADNPSARLTGWRKRPLRSDETSPFPCHEVPVYRVPAPSRRI